MRIRVLLGVWILGLVLLGPNGASAGLGGLPIAAEAVGSALSDAHALATSSAHQREHATVAADQVSDGGGSDSEVCTVLMTLRSPGQPCVVARGGPRPMPPFSSVRPPVPPPEPGARTEQLSNEGAFAGAPERAPLARSSAGAREQFRIISAHSASAGLVLTADSQQEDIFGAFERGEHPDSEEVCAVPMVLRAPGQLFIVGRAGPRPMPPLASRGPPVPPPQTGAIEHFSPEHAFLGVHDRIAGVAASSAVSGSPSHSTELASLDYSLAATAPQGGFAQSDTSDSSDSEVCAVPMVLRAPAQRRIGPRAGGRPMPPLSSEGPPVPPPQPAETAEHILTETAPIGIRSAAGATAPSAAAGIQPHETYPQLTVPSPLGAHPAAVPAGFEHGDNPDSEEVCTVLLVLRGPSNLAPPMSFGSQSMGPLTAVGPPVPPPQPRTTLTALMTDGAFRDGDNAGRARQPEAGPNGSRVSVTEHASARFLSSTDIYSSRQDLVLRRGPESVETDPRARLAAWTQDAPERAPSVPTFTGTEKAP